MLWDLVQKAFVLWANIITLHGKSSLNIYAEMVNCRGERKTIMRANAADRNYTLPTGEGRISGSEHFAENR